MRDLFRPLAVSVHVVDIAKYADTLSALVCRPPAFEVVHEDAPELRKESEGETENQASSIILELLLKYGALGPKTSHSTQEDGKGADVAVTMAECVLGAYRYDNWNVRSGWAQLVGPRWARTL
ncbi:hypothetical protein P692DRAFT_20865786 [Suillus brevipes Sb2]|nr:hypothetical protein P692DRAFT_20865786 [Suillus brevipes Sb2]